jgi:toxin-antitoxin system PIN domain toxin
MIIPDVNLLMYAHNAASATHDRSRKWWEDLIRREQPIGLPWAVAFGFIRLATHPSVLADPLPPLEAVACVRSWMDEPSVRIVEPGPRHMTIVEDLLRATGVAGSLTTDTHLAALAIEHQADLHSNDADFGRFPGLRWRNPLK